MAPIYQFGKFVLNVQEQLLTVDGLPVHLPAKEFETLQMLVENNGRVLSKDEMLATIWKDTFVEESNLTQYVSRLRKTLNVDGNQYIKTISKRGYRFSADVKVSDGDLIIERNLRVKVGGEPKPGLGEINSVAVLPFLPLTDPDDEEFFGLGIADALITQLTRSGKIIARPTASVLKFRSPNQDPVAIAELLNVDAILEGNFQKSGNRLRLTAQLLGAGSGHTLWAESFNTEIDDIFDVQDRIASLVVNALSKHYSSGNGANPAKRYTENKAAYEEYLKGRFHFSKRTAESLTKALAHFETAIEIDPSYALAYAGKAETYQLLPLSDSLEPHVAFPKAKAAALRALEIDDTIAEAHVALAAILMDFDWNWQGAELSFQKAIELNPNYAAAHQVYGTLLLRLGRIGDAILELKKAQLLDPLSPAISTWMGDAFANLGEHEAAIQIHKETIKSSPEYLFAHYFLVQSYVRTGQLTEAKKAAEDAVALSDDMSLTRSASIYLKAHTGDREGARAELAALIEKRKKTYVSAVNIASGFAVLKETDSAFEWLERAVAERDSNLTWLNVDHEFAYLADDPRFQSIARRVNLPAVKRTEVRESAPSEEVRTPAPFGTLAKFTLASLAVIAVVGAGYFLSRLAPGTSANQIEKNTLIRLTDSSLDDAYPTFTHDGRIRFARFLDKRTMATYVMNADGSDVREQTEIRGLSSGSWSPDGTKVFFRRNGDPDFYFANADGSGEMKMPFRPGNCGWSADSKQFLYQAKGADTSVSQNNSDIFIYTLETGESRAIVESPYFDSDPTFSPDGKSIVYASDVEGNFEIYTKLISTGETKRLTYWPSHDSFPTYSPDGTQIIFNSDVEKENNDVYLMNTDGSNVRKLTDGPGWDAVPANSWSADGTKVLILSDLGGKENIYLMHIEPFVPRRISPDVESVQPLDPSYSPTADHIVYQTPDEIRMLEVGSETDRSVFKTSAGAGPTFSPDGRTILFQERIDDNTEICSIGVDGTGFTNLTQSSSRDMSPAYSPDGARIAFASNRAYGTSTFEIYVMNADGSQQTLVYGDRAMSGGPTWSPDGKVLVFTNDREDGRVGNFELFSIGIDGGTPARLTTRARYDVNPAFSPDGRRVAFVSNTDGNPEIYVMNADGTSLLRLTRDPGNDVAPRWSPDGKKLIFTSDRSGKYGIYEIEL
jgi:Tol biopolymer transport system component/TolB-like protein/DNA-binding winged helix-turn-helix (wHTH) protein